MMAGYDEEELVQAIETTIHDDVSRLCNVLPGSFCHRQPDMTICNSGLPISRFNGIIGPRFRSDAVSERVEVAMSYFQSARIPMCWVLGPSSAPPELEEYLSGHGFTLEQITSGMAIDLSKVDPEPLPAGLVIRPVKDMGSLRDFIEISAMSFELPDDTREGWAKISSKLHGEPDVHMFLGVLNGIPVSTSLVVLHDHVAGIYMVATLVRERGKGIGSAMTREPLLFAKDAGRHVAVLEASEIGLSVYERLGFSKLFEFRSLTWMP